MARTITYREAINEALAQEMERDERVIVMGEDNAGGEGSPGEADAWGGVLGVTKGLYGKFPGRVLDTPISESAFVGAAVGAATGGLRPVAELMFIDFMGVCFDQIFNQAAKFRYMFGGKAVTPVVIRTMWGAGLRAAAQHSQSLLPVFTHIPGLKVVAPSNPYDAKGLLIQSIRDDDPVIFAEHKMLYDTSGDVPEESYTIPFGEANIVREGGDVTIVAIGRMVNTALEAADGAGVLGDRGRDHRPAHHQPAGPGHDPGVGGEHRAAGRGGRVQPALLAGLGHRGVGGAGGVRVAAGADPDGHRAAHAGAVHRLAGGPVHPGRAPRSPARSRRPPTGRSEPTMTDDRIQRVTMPKWGLSMKTGKIVEWFVAEGDTITKGDDLVDIETDKIAGTLESPEEGLLRRIVAEPGSDLPIGAVLAVLAPSEVPDADIEAVVEEARAAVESGELEGGDEPAPQLVEVGGRTISYLTLAPGGARPADPVVLVHGFGGDKNSWLFVQQPLSETHAVHALDLPGHGASGKDVGDGSLATLADTVIGFLDALGISRAHLVGHSLGGAVIAAVAKAAPDKVASLTLLAPAGYGAEADAEYLRGFAAASSRRELKPLLGRLFADESLVTRQLVDDLLQVQAARRRGQGARRGAEHPARRRPAGHRHPRPAGRGGRAGDRGLGQQRPHPAPPPPRARSRCAAGHMLHMEAANDVLRHLQLPPLRPSSHWNERHFRTPGAYERAVRSGRWEGGVVHRAKCRAGEPAGSARALRARRRNGAAAGRPVASHRSRSRQAQQRASDRADHREAALLYAGPGAVITGTDALELHGMRRMPRRRVPIHVLVPADRRRVGAGRVFVERTERLPNAVSGPLADGSGRAGRPGLRAPQPGPRHRAGHARRGGAAGPVHSGTAAVTSWRPGAAGDRRCRGRCSPRSVTACARWPRPTRGSWCSARRLPPPIWNPRLLDRRGPVHRRAGRVVRRRGDGLGDRLPGVAPEPGGLREHPRPAIGDDGRAV